MLALEIILPLIAFSTVAIGTYALLSVCNPYWMRVRDRVGELELSGAWSNAEGGRLRSFADRRSRLIDQVQQLNPYHDIARSKLQRRLAKAGIYDSTAIPLFFVARLALAIVPVTAVLAVGMAGYMSFETAMLSAAVSGGLGSLAPSFWLDRTIARQQLQFQKSLPDFLDLMIVCLEGGLSLQETIRRVTDELRIAHPALASELRIVQRDVELGATVDQALKRFAIRTDYEGVRTLSTFIREAQRFGTNITDALRGHADMLRSQREQRAEENAQKAAVKILLPTLLLIFPATFVVLVGPAVIQIHEAFAVR